MEKWGVDDVVRFIRAIPNIPERAKESACAQVYEKHIDGSKLQQCGTLSRCQDFFSINVVHCQTISQYVKSGVMPTGVTAASAVSSSPAPPSVSLGLPQSGNSNSKPTLDIFSLDILSMKVTDVKWVSGGLGSTGVFFVQTADGMFVAKPCSTRTAGEIYASILADRLGIATANIFVPDLEKQEILKDKLLWAPWSNATDKDRMRNERVALISLIAYVPGTPLPACAITLLQEPATHKRAILTEIGRIMLMDIVINNFDRLPLCWKNDGNPDNILVRIPTMPNSDAVVVAIDSTLTCIRNSDGYQRYVDTVRSTLAELHASRTAQSACMGTSMRRVCDSLLNCTGYAIDDEGCAMLVEGLKLGCRQLKSLRERESLWAEVLLAETSSRCGTSIGGTLGLEDIRSDFLNAVANAVLDSDFAQ